MLEAGPATPNTLYYNCEYHSAMAGTINVINGETAFFKHQPLTLTNQPKLIDLIDWIDTNACLFPECML